MLKHYGLTAAFCVAAIAAAPAMAKVSEEEAARLGKEGELTFSGAIWNGNDDGTIPVWTGDKNFNDEQKNLRAKRLAKLRKDPDALATLLGGDIADAKSQFTITSADYEKYKDKLTESHIQMFKKYPATYKMNVYESVRGHFNHPDIDKATVVNATTAKLEGTDDISGHSFGFPFPIPKKGAEVLWNHKLKYRGASVRRFNNQAIVDADGTFNVTKIIEDILFGYANLDQPKVDKGLLAYYLQEIKSPPRLAGRLTLVHETADPTNGGRLAWLYDPGTRRINRAPKIGYDNPSLSTDGEQFNDQVDVFNGAQNRYQWKLVGLQEKYIPYNSYDINSPRHKYADMIRKGHVNPDFPRYELHRVWVVEATLAPGMTHQIAKRVFYVDEDSWSIAVVDGYNNQGKFWKFQESHLATLPMVPITTGSPESIHDLITGRFFLTALSNEEKLSDYDAKFKPGEFKPTALKRRIR